MAEIYLLRERGRENMNDSKHAITKLLLSGSWEWLGVPTIPPPEC